jgi:hypothetical protein
VVLEVRELLSLAEMKRTAGEKSTLSEVRHTIRMSRQTVAFRPGARALHYPGLKKQWVEFLGERPDAQTTRVELAETAAV